MKGVYSGLLALALAVASQAWTTPYRRTARIGSAMLKSTSAVNNNVVLRPSEESEAFDSFKIGSPRVHRYLRDSGTSEGEAEYVMWYHGRSKEQNDDKSLPPLSTGRIGRATSLNGLHWKKTQEGSLSEDIPGVSLGLNKESWWGFDTYHVGLGQVLLPMSTPAVMAEGGVYLMYYMGGTEEERKVSDYLDNVPESAADAKIKGMKMRIGVAVSQDGLSWGRVEGDDPSGACMPPYDKDDPNMEPVANMRDENNKAINIEEELYCGWPEVVVDEEAKNKGSPFLMYYSTMTKQDKKKCIAYAVSEDGFRWFKRGVCVEPGDDGLDVAGCARCTVLKKAVYNEDDAKWVEAEGFEMFYEGVAEDGKHRIMMATSADGRSWEKVGVVFDVADEDTGAWDCKGVGTPNVIRMDDGTMRMYYTGQGVDGSTAIGVAKLLAGAGSETWMREQAQLTFA